MAVCLILTLLPATALAADDDGLPTASEKNFFANGTPITISESAPANGAKTTLSGLTTGTSAYISWDDNGTTKYVGVPADVVVWGGGDGSQEAVTVSDTSITMTGGKVYSILGGNFGKQNQIEEDCSSVTGNVDISVSGGTVTNIIYGGGENNTCVNGTVTITLDNVELGNCYVNGGVLGHGPEGTRNIDDGTMSTYAVVDKVVINATNTKTSVLGGGGSGSTKVLDAVVTLDGCRVGYLYASGINGEMGNSSLKATNCTITGELAATNRGFIKTADVTLVDCDVELLMTGATTGCFSTDSGYPDGSAITESIVWNIDDATTVKTALLTPMVKRDGNKEEPVYTATTQNTTIQKDGEPLNIEFAEFTPSTKLPGKVDTLTVPEGSTLTLKNVQMTVPSGQTLTNAGTIDMDETSVVTIANGATMEAMGTVNGGKVENNGTEKKYIARVGNVGYDSLQAAIDDAGKKATVTLLQGTQEDINISNDKDIVLDLNGQKITNNPASTATHTITVDLGGKLTVQDTVGGGIVDNVSHGCAAIWNNGTAVLNGGKYDRSLENGLSSSDPGGNSYYVLVNHGNMEINDGVTVEQNGHFSSMIENGYYSYNSKNPSSGYVPNTNAQYPALTINGGSFSGGLNTVKNDGGGKLEINGGNFSNVSQAVVLNWNEATINDGTFTVTKPGVESVILNGYADSAIDTGKLTITGGTFTSNTGAPVLTTMNNSAAQHSGTIEITGGTLNGDIVLTDPQDDGTLEISQGAVINGDIINKKFADVTVTGGTVTGQVTNSGDGNITVTGGSFPNADVSGFVSDGYYTVTFNCAGGDPIPSRVVAEGKEITLPGCTHSSYHYKFDGWKCGNATYYAGDEVEVNSNMTFTAQWKERFPDGPSSGGSSSVSDNEYAVTVDAGKHGDVSVSPKWAEEGDTVTITADPDNGYVVDEVIVTDKNGDDIRVRDRGDGEYTFTMPDSKVTVEVTFVEAGDELSFVDVAKSDYYYDAVKWAVENGVTTGVTDTIFAPGNPCTRAQTVTFLWRAAGMPQAANRVNPFTDVSVNDYYYEAVLWAVENGITGGTTATTFSPNATCTRAQVVTFLWRYSKEDASILPMFTDVAEGDYYYGAVAWAVENGVTTGVTDTTFAPGNPCTRGQIVTFLYRYMGK